MTYPAAVFPPTDCHSATLLGDSIYVIGNLGYPADRQLGKTPIFKLDLASYGMEEVPSSGESPGWINNHKAALDNDRGIVVSAGLRHVLVNDKVVEIENADTYRLCLDTSVWTRISRD